MEISEHEKPFNRLIIVGNGFDIAYGLNTTYSDFILDYFKKNAIEAFRKGRQNTELLEIQIEYFDPQAFDDTKRIIAKMEDVKDLISLIKNHGIIKYDDDLFGYLIDYFTKNNWVDVEALYYDRLMSCYHGSSVDAVCKMNVSFENIRQALSIYIKEEQQRHVSYYNKPIFEEFFYNMFLPLEWNFAELVKNHRKKYPPENVMFLDFNYTDTIEALIKAYPKFKSRALHISIHGSVNDINNPIIFGYGDDTDENYRKLEMKRDNEWLTKIKSFHYPRTNNYHKLLNFISLGDFDVFIVGHSCGLSDRTLLKTIFEHENCLAIKNYHYKGESEDFSKRMEISRHFNDKIKMRERLFPFDKYALIPQAKSK